jgi:predicted permease
MSPRWLAWLVRLLPIDAREEVLREMLEQRARILAHRGRLAAWRWAWRQPIAVLASREVAEKRSVSNGLFEDAVSAQRTMRRRPGLAVTVVATVAIAVAAVAAVASILDAVVFRPLPYPDAGRLVWLASHQPTDGSAPFDPQRAASASSNPMDVVDWARRARHFTAITPFETFDGTVQAGARPVRVMMASVRANVGALLGIRAQYGRLFTEVDEEPAARSVVLSNRLWRSAFGADPAVVGRRVDVGGTDPHEVVGILPELPLGFPHDETDVWFVLRPPPSTFQNRGGVWQRVVARLDPGVSLEVAGDDMARIARELAAEHPDSNTGRAVRVVPYREGLIGTTRPVLWLLAVSVLLVLVIACANIGHLLLVNAQARQRELAIRAALGASPARLARLLLVESALLAGLGGLAGTVLAPWCLRVFLRLYPESLPSVGEVRVQWLALAAATAATLIAALVALLPSLLANRRAATQEALKAGERGLEAGGQRRLRALFVVTQVAVSTALLIGGGLLVRTFLNVRSVDVGFAPDNVLTFNIAVSQARYPALADEVRLQAALLERIRRMPGVQAAGASTLLPFAPGEFGDGFYRVGFNDVYPNIPIARLQVVTPGYFEAVGLPLRGGRTLTQADTAGSQPVVIVNEALQARDFPAGALGRQIRFRGVVAEIVGVVGAKHHRSLRETPRPEMYYPRAQVAHPRFLAWFAVRADAAPESLAAPIREALAGLDPTLAIDSVGTLGSRIDRALAPDRFRASLVGALAIVALLLAGLGLYGLIAHAVARDARAIAIRMALGASSGHAVRQVVGSVMLLTLTGAAGGAALASAGHSLFEGFLAGVTPFDPVTVVLVAALLVAAALAAAVGPATRASRVDPAAVLRP